MSKWIRSGDKVMVIAGNDKGKVGEVVARDKTRVLVKGINVRKRHMKPQGQNKMGEILQIEKPVHISNVALCPDGEKRAKVKLKVSAKGEKELVYTDDGKSKVYRNIIKQTKSKKK